MTVLPQRISLVSQTANILLQEIAAGTWHDWLPGERTLCEMLQVSRNTLRAALAQLKKDGGIKSSHGAGNQILAGHVRAKSRPKSHDVAVLTPEPLTHIRPSQTLWIDELRATLSERGCRLRVFHGHQYFRTNPGPRLQDLVQRSPHGCWILTLSNEKVQNWFAKSRVPCVVAGSIYPGIDLPFRDLDHRAMCRHAAGVLLGLGHRKIGLVTHRSRRAGDVASEEGFIEGMSRSPHPDAEGIVLVHEETTASVCNLVRRLREQQNPPTALLVVNPNYYLTVTSRLAQIGARVPQDFSVISRDEDPFLSFVVPEPARYVVNPHVMAKALLRPVLELLQGEVVTQRANRIMPKFIRGGSIAPWSARARAG
jgi:LacI family transcriptional regulator